MTPDEEVQRIMDEVAADIRKLCDVPFVGTPQKMTLDVPASWYEVELTIEGEDEREED